MKNLKVAKSTKTAEDFKDDYINLLQKGYQPDQIEKFVKDVQKSPEVVSPPKPKMSADEAYLAGEEEKASDADNFKGKQASRNKKASYEDIVYIDKQSEYEEFETILEEEGKDAAMKYLKQWHTPGEHEIVKTNPAGASDKTYEKNGYIMSWNPKLGYAGLVCEVEDKATPKQASRSAKAAEFIVYLSSEDAMSKKSFAKFAKILSEQGKDAALEFLKKNYQPKGTGQEQKISKAQNEYEKDGAYMTWDDKEVSFYYVDGKNTASVKASLRAKKAAYEDIVYIDKEAEYEEFETILEEEGKDAAMKYLKQWHTPGEHEIVKTNPAGASDKTYEKNGYIMSWNPKLGYAGLVCEVEDKATPKQGAYTSAINYLSKKEEKPEDLGKKGFPVKPQKKKSN